MATTPTTPKSATKIAPGSYGFPVQLKKRYDNYIGGKWTPPSSGQYFDNVTPVTGQVICQIARSNAADVEKALDAAHAAKGAWGKSSQAFLTFFSQRSNPV